MTAIFSSPLNVSMLAPSILLALTWLAACTSLRENKNMNTSTPPTEAPPTKIMTTPAPRKMIELPKPSLEGAVSLEEALVLRRSIREFTTQLLSETELGQLLWAAQGQTHPSGYRTAPSAGALYPLEMYAVLPEGVYHYHTDSHRLLLHLPGDMRPALFEAALRQESVLQAPSVIVLTAVFERTAQKYGRERGQRYVHLETGHAAQNVLLQATALGLGGVPVGAFWDDQVSDVLGLPEDHQPLYLIPIGHPK